MMSIHVFTFSLMGQPWSLPSGPPPPPSVGVTLPESEPLLESSDCFLTWSNPFSGDLGFCLIHSLTNVTFDLASCKQDGIDMMLSIKSVITGMLSDLHKHCFQDTDFFMSKTTHL